MNCLIYLRVSTKEQVEKGLNEEGLSIPAQREACLRYIQEKQWKFVDEYVDRGESARTSLRPQLQEMLSRIKKDKSINFVVIHKIDRLARNMEDHVAIKAILKRHNVSLISVVENIEDSASGRLIEGIHALMAEFYSANLGMETKKGMLQKVKQGGWPQVAPLGYQNVTKVIQGRTFSTIEVDQERAPIIKEAFRLYSTGNYSINELRDIVTERGLMTRGTRKWSSRPVTKSNLCRMLQHKIYKGVIEWDGVQSKGQHEPLVSKEVFDRVQEVIKVHSTAGDRKRKHFHYLKGTVFCGECESRLSTDLAKEKYSYFYCLGKKRRNGCEQNYIEVSDLETTIEELYRQMQLTPPVVEQLRESFEKELLSREETTIAEQRLITRRLTALADERHKVLQAYYAGAISIDLLRSEQKRIDDDSAKAEDRLDAVNASKDQLQKIIDQAIMMAGSCYYAYKKASPKTRRMFNQAFFKKVFVKDRRVSGVEYTALFDFLFSALDNKKNSLFCGSSSKVELAPRVGLEPTTFRLTAERSTD